MQTFMEYVWEEGLDKNSTDMASLLNVSGIDVSMQGII